MTEVLGNLKDKDISETTIIRRENFVSLTRRMRELYVVGARDLGNTMIEAEALLNEGKRAEARENIARFSNNASQSFILILHAVS